MANACQEYNLIHITTGGEYKAPLVASQLFDQAEWQAITKEGFAPAHVEAWIVGAFREYYDKTAQEKVKSLIARCPHIKVFMMNGISRLNRFPVLALMLGRRKKMGKDACVVYHCRGEKSVEWAVKMRSEYPQDRIILDVRGYWPAEKLYAKGITDHTTATGQALADYTEAYDYLKRTVATVDSVTTVSNALKELLVDELGAPADTSVVPCCVSAVTDDSKRAELRDAWGLKEEDIALVYSGTTAAYQHLDDLTIPFLKRLQQENSNIKLVFLSSEYEKIKQMLLAEGMDVSKVILKSFKQNEVAAALTACDAGILIRKPTLVNRVANPVKIAEYMAAGLPIIIEKGVGGVADSLFDSGLLKGIEIAGGGDMGPAARSVNEWINSGLDQKRIEVRKYAKVTYLWQSAIQVSRKMYIKVLNKQR